MKSYYFDDDEKYSIGTAAKKAESVSTNIVANCHNVSYTPVDYDVDTGDPIWTGIYIDTGTIDLLNPTDVTGSLSVTGPITAEGVTGSIDAATTITAEETIQTGTQFELPLTGGGTNPPEGFATIYVNASNQLCSKKHDGSEKVIVQL